MDVLKPRFRVILSTEVKLFLKSLPPKVTDKIAYNLKKAQYVQDKDLFKKLGGCDIWEFRTAYQGHAYRLLAFWDSETDSLVVVTHGFIKKSQKTPTKEIDKAIELRRIYLSNKKSLL